METTGSENKPTGGPGPVEQKNSRPGFFRRVIKNGISDQQANLVDSVFKSLGIVGAIIAFYWGIQEFKISSERDFKKELYLEQIAIMTRTVDVVSTLATHDPASEKFEEARAGLEKLKVGELYLFADPILTIMVSKFSSDFDRYLKRQGIFQSHLKNQSHNITRHCKAIIENLGKLKK